jgi:hypothetical protein
VDGFTAGMMRSFACCIWVELGVSGTAPVTWGQVDMESRKGYYRAMNIAFFELRLCDANWKADQIATDFYSSWYSKWRSHIQTSYTLPAEVEVNAPPKPGPSRKRKAKSSVSLKFTKILLKLTQILVC